MSIVAAMTAFTGIAYLFDNRQTLEELSGLSLKTTHPDARTGNPLPNVFVRAIGSAFFTGYAPFASGTVGSALALAVYFIPGFDGPYVIMPAMVGGFLLGAKVGDLMEAHYGHDPAEVTIDEVVGMWLALFLLPKSLFVAAVAFVLFRAFDIVKPYPAKLFDRQAGGFGIMMDDVVAGFYANLATHALIAIPYFKHFV
jgi:phosphatidylglycerophosphatase A